MSKIFITGDTHKNIDIQKLNTTLFPEQKKLTKEDYLIITGDFGMVWDDSKEDLYLRKQLNNRNFTTLWVDGNHENFDLIEKYPIKEWNGGKVHFVEDSIIHLMRGQVYIINGLKFFTMGGGTSIDKEFRTKGKTWWPQEEPSEGEYVEAINNLKKHDFKVDYIITHTTSNEIQIEMNYIKENSELNKFFDMLEEKVKHKHWYFGHFHDTKTIGKHTLLYNNIKEII